MTGHFQRPPHVAVVDGLHVSPEADVVYVADLDAATIATLEDTAALIWREADGQSAEGLVDRVATASGHSADKIASDVERFIDDLVDRGLLERVDD